MTITRKVISRMQWWTSPTSSTKGLHSTALSKSLSQTYAKVRPSLQKLFSEAFPCYCAVPEAVPWSWSVVTHIEGAVYQSVTLESPFLSKIITLFIAPRPHTHFQIT